MGTNRRYAEQIADRMGERLLIEAAKAYPLQSLSDAELALDVLPVTRDPRPRKVRAWVRFGPAPFRVDAEAVMWTGRAIAVRFLVDGAERRCWVWGSAVEEGEAEPRGAAASR